MRIERVRKGRTVRRSWQTYDPADRLTADNTSGTGAHIYAYSYDSRGNILTNNETGTTITHTYDAASRLTTSIEGSDITTYTYDLNGNLTAAEKGASAGYMQYSPENQMSYYEDETADGTYYLYDPFARMKSSIYFAGLNYAYTWDDNLIIRQDDSAGVRRSFTQVGGQIVGEVTGLPGSAVTKSYLEDFLGSVTGEVSTSNVVSNARRLTPYGRDWLGAATVAHSPSWIGGHGYHPTGLKWAGYSVFHRIVTPETGQWTTRDPLWPWELAYGYVNGNPTTWIDPGGLAQLFPHENWDVPAKNYISNLILKLRQISLATDGFYDCLDGCNPISSGTVANPVPRDPSTSDVIKDLIAGKDGVHVGYPIRVETKTDCPEGCCGKAEFYEGPGIWGNAKWAGWYITICVDRVKVGGKDTYKPRDGCGPSHCVLLHELLHTLSLTHSGDPDLPLDDAFFECISKVPGCEAYTATTATPGKARCPWKKKQ